MKRIIQLSILLCLLISCQKNKVDMPNLDNNGSTFISGVDISRYPEIADSSPKFYDLEGKEKDFLDILKENGVNTIRLRLWVNPSNEHSGFNEVKQFSQRLKSKGFKTLLTVHYSDTWADPAHQETPALWQELSFADLKDSVYQYTARIINELEPNYIQIGNEINPGLLHPNGHFSTNFLQFKELMEMGITAVRDNSTDTQIIIHYAGIDGSDWFFNKIKTLDYDIIGLSYYPIWHGKSLDSLKTTMQHLSNTYNKKILIAETSYAFTLEWNDWTNNIIGSDEQLITPAYPATKEGQRSFIAQIRTLTKEVENGIGFCYWGGELIAWKGDESTDASSWENQALFDFDNKALPVLKEFKIQ
ncbi:MAG: glycosyl hydrolase 53 family protein [Paludibacteraceae bacterium]|nr:glycosyl hydrolase 53 family protein [Paludibacteraceae bacterium]